ncbi:Bug family tripartite tricarboxylate transporter substrate binding protein [Bradyrhizobium icense]|uniref:Branched-chain alpha-keto acid dehydrogenase subunit E2 n=1 Tax=Bradyrhizobium icense TaxID=1274631 RepID=A0A1B1URB0_9BRAD|nr:tripartite tricarboxylate transporter substrate binding protein [Bradyrhizobium icense]ANW05299.1 branched-chain alpha-keto acid dehydrogenase subunit E2 [Bradyrhizobium icense]
MRWLTLLVALLVTMPAAAQDWPSRTIRVIVPYPAGGPADFMGRLAAQKLQEKLGATVVVENRSGASGTIGAETVRQSAPDGYTFLAAPSVHVLGRQVVKAVPYDPVDDFTPIARYGEGPLVVLANPAAVQGKTITEALAEIRKKRDDFRFGLSALGAANHLAVLEFNKLTGLNLQIIPYRGSAPALTDLVSGQVQLMIDPIITALPLVQGGQLRALAVTSARRSSVLPELPTTAESGLPGLEFSSWYGLWGPRNLPKEIVTKVNAVLTEGMRDPAVIERLKALGFEPVSGTPEEFASFIATDLARNSALLSAINFQPQ